MGLFSKKDSAPSRKPNGKPRPSVTSEAQAAELRIKARRRLAGAVALILAAVVVLPMLLDSEPTPVASNIPIRIPDRQTPFQPQLSEPDSSSGSSANAGSTGQVSGTSDPNSVSSPNTAQTTSASATPSQSKADITPKQDSASNAATKPATPPASAQPRRDEAARALALLEGRNPVVSAPSPKPPVRGNFVVQAMSLDSSADAQKQRNILISAGLNNAFVDGPVDVNGRPKYRVRVGPFQSREAAQAAQTRLRTQGYGGAFITAQ
ncbi:MAG: SPOR domain-containing protein [Burkholderiales bacterium]|jgi:DedD protein|nr:SPOR domain-containing protein [Burkholderiales bacterium]MDP4909178.1 SPOR domain-containing protein [Burkholderiaceae bacterium]